MATSKSGFVSLNRMGSINQMLYAIDKSEANYLEYLKLELFTTEYREGKWIDLSDKARVHCFVNSTMSLCLRSSKMKEKDI